MVPSSRRATSSATSWPVVRCALRRQTAPAASSRRCCGAATADASARPTLATAPAPCRSAHLRRMARARWQGRAEARKSPSHARQSASAAWRPAPSTRNRSPCCEHHRPALVTAWPSPGTATTSPGWLATTRATAAGVREVAALAKRRGGDQDRQHRDLRLSLPDDPGRRPAETGDSCTAQA